MNPAAKRKRGRRKRNRNQISGGAVAAGGATGDRESENESKKRKMNPADINWLCEEGHALEKVVCSAVEGLWCDGKSHKKARPASRRWRSIPNGEEHWTCSQGCDFDMCSDCATKHKK